MTKVYTNCLISALMLSPVSYAAVDAPVLVAQQSEILDKSKRIFAVQFLAAAMEEIAVELEKGRMLTDERGKAILARALLKLKSKYLPDYFVAFMKDAKPILTIISERSNKAESDEELKSIFTSSDKEFNQILKKHPKAKSMLDLSDAQANALNELREDEEFASMMMDEMEEAGEGANPALVLAKVARHMSEKWEQELESNSTN